MKRPTNKKLDVDLLVILLIINGKKPIDQVLQTVWFVFGTRHYGASRGEPRSLNLAGNAVTALWREDRFRVCARPYSDDSEALRLGSTPN